MAASLPTTVSKKSHDAIIQFVRSCATLQSSQWNMRESFLQVDRDYMREKDFTKENLRARAANSMGDVNRLQNLQVPIVKPQVETAVAYQSSVFLQQQPLFPVISDPEYIDEAMQFNSILQENSIRGGWVRHLMMFFRDGFKYKFGATEVVWDQQTTAAIDTDLKFSAKQGKPRNIIWEGNCIRRLNPYNVIFDKRVALADIPEWGEFAGYTDIYGRIALKQFIANLPSTMNVTDAFESGIGSMFTNAADFSNYYIPPLNPNSRYDQSTLYATDWMSWAGLVDGRNSGIQYKNLYQVTTMYARILISDFGISGPEQNTPQIWKFIIVNNQICIYAERQTNAHNKLPILFCNPQEDGLDYQTKSLAEDVSSVQNISTGLWASVIASRRRAISDRMLYDPSRITKENINSENPSAKIPVRPSAYGKPLQESVYHMPFSDDQLPALMSLTQNLGAYADVITGHNKVQQGQFVKGNKTNAQFDQTMQTAVGRDQMTAMLLEAQFFIPMKEIIKINTLQYQGSGNVYNAQQKQMVKVDPVALRKAVLEFPIGDGLAPANKQIGDDVLMVAMQQIGSSPQLASGYNLAPMFSYLMKTEGADISPFEKSPQQIQFEQATQAWQQTVQTIMEAALKNKDIDPAKVQASLPPQPKPQDYGYDPTKPASSQSNEMYQQQPLLQQVMQVDSQGNNPATSAPTAQPNNSNVQ